MTAENAPNDATFCAEEGSPDGVALGELPVVGRADELPAGAPLVLGDEPPVDAGPVVEPEPAVGAGAPDDPSQLIRKDGECVHKHGEIALRTSCQRDWPERSIGR